MSDSRLKKIREDKGVKQNAIYSHLGISRQTYAKFEDNPSSMRIDQAQAVCDFLGISLEDIFLPEDVKETNSDCV